MARNERYLVCVQERVARAGTRGGAGRMRMGMVIEMYMGMGMGTWFFAWLNTSKADKFRCAHGRFGGRDLAQDVEWRCRYGGGTGVRDAT